jgi:hypothetical protein
MDEKPTNTNPFHYKKTSIETIDYMKELVGTFEFISHCRLTALKYLSRAGSKKEKFDGDDFAKAAWYCQMAAHMKNPAAFRDPREMQQGM